MVIRMLVEKPQSKSDYNNSDRYQENKRSDHNYYSLSFFNSFTNAGIIAIIIIKNGSVAAIEMVCNGFKLPAESRM